MPIIKIKPLQPQTASASSVIPIGRSRNKPSP